MITANRFKDIMPMYKQNMFSKLLKEPLLHFLLIGAGLFFLFSQLNSDEQTDNREKIVVTKSKVEVLIDTFVEANGTMPTQQEIQKLVEDDIHKEVLYREALAIGLDKDDMVIRHRLAQKMKYLFEEDISLGQSNESFYENLKSAYEIIIDDEVRKEFNVSVQAS